MVRGKENCSRIKVCHHAHGISEIAGRLGNFRSGAIASSFSSNLLLGMYGM
jgi:hypothetical protein